MSEGKKKNKKNVELTCRIFLENCVYTDKQLRAHLLFY